MAIRRKPVTPEEHYTIISNAWARDDRLSLKARGLLALILSHRVGWNISIESLARTNPEGKAAIRTAVTELERGGYLRREHVRDEGGSFVGYDYVLADPPACENRTPPFENRTGSFDYPTTDNPTTGNRTPKKTIPKKTISKNTHADASVQAFSAFWSAYPATQKGSKKAAASKYQGLLKKMSHDDLMARLVHYKRTRQRQQRSNEFVPNVPHATTWLNQERWNDYGEFDPTTATTGPESLTIEEINEALGPTNWAPPEPEEPPEDQAAWLREQYAEHHRQRQYQAWEVINGKAG